MTASGLRQEVWAKVSFSDSILGDAEQLDSLIESAKSTARQHVPEGRQVIFSQPTIRVPHKRGALASLQVIGIIIAESVTMPT